MKKNLLFTFTFLCLCIAIHAQVIRNYGLVYSSNIKGGHTMFGNTSMATPDPAHMNEFNGSGTYYDALYAAYFPGMTGMTTTYMNNNESMAFIDVDGSYPAINLIDNGGNWKYFSTGAAPANSSGNDWKQIAYNDGSWFSGAAKLGYGGSQTTTISGQGTSSSNYYINAFTTSYFRYTFSVNNPTNTFSSLSLNLTYDDGAVVYLNGTEVARDNMPTGTPNYSTSASSDKSNATMTFTIPATSLANGTNVIAVEVHRRYTTPGSQTRYTDGSLSFDLSLQANPVQTANSSSADLVLPAGTNDIKFARLYWGGKYTSSAFTDAQLKAVKLKKDGDTYQELTAASDPDKWTPSGSDVTSYQAYTDITDYISTHGSGTYTVADISASTGQITNGAYAGWSIVVVYENDNSPYNSVRIFDGYVNVYTGGTASQQSITLNDLNVPNNSLSLEDAYMSTMVWEGEGNLASTSATSAGDYLKINGTAYKDAVNPVKNMWNGTISKNGALVTAKSPDYKNQMGIDIDEIQIGSGYGIQPNDRSVSIQFGTEYDEYFASAVAFTIRMKDPEVSLTSTVTDMNGGDLLLNEELQYTLSGINSGYGPANKSTLSNTLSPNVTLVPNSIEILQNGVWVPAGIAGAQYTYTPATNTIKFYLGTGADAASNKGGTLDVDAGYDIRFKVVVNSYGTIDNIALLSTSNGLDVESAKNSETNIAAAASVLPVTFKTLNGKLKPGFAQLTWTTETEENTSHFEIERSYNGRKFEKAGQVNAQGNSTLILNYQFNDSAAVNKFEKTVYYRLKVVDFDGKTDYSSIIALSLNATYTTESIAIFPNPVSAGSNLKVQVKVDHPQQIVIRFMNLSGHTLLNLKKNVQPGGNALTLNELNNLKAGLYFIEIITDKGRYAQNLLKD